MIALLCLALLAAAPAVSAGVVVRLGPEMPAASAAGVPRLYEVVPDADRVEKTLRLSPAAAYHWVVAPGEPMSVQVSASSGAKGAKTRLTAWDWQNRPVFTEEHPAPFDQTITFETSGRGCYTLTLDLFDGDRCTARLVRSFAVCPDNRQRRALWTNSGFFVGACSFPGRQHWANDFGPAHPPDLTEQASREMDAELSAKMGLQVIRIDPPVQWASADSPLDFTRADAAIQVFVTNGFTLDIQLDPAPDWAVLPSYRNRKDPLWRYPHQEGATRRLASACARRYGRYAAFFEIYNEPDNRDFWRGTVPEFLDYTRWCAEEIRQAAPGVPIANGGYTLLEPEQTGAIVRGVREQTDLAAYHYHGTVDALPAAFGAYRAMHAAAGYAPPAFVDTEMGYAAWRLDVERNMAAAIVQKLLFSWAHGHKGALIYCTRDIGGPRQRPADPDCGCLDYFMCPRRAYGAVSGFVDHLAGLRADSVLCEKPQLFAYAFKGRDRRVLALFAPDESGRTVTVVSDATSAAVVDVMGNATPAGTPASIAVHAQLYPSYVILHAATKVRLEGLP